jgi:hypothetical protein
VRRYLDTGDAKSTGNMHKHAKKCWGAETVELANKAKNAAEVHVTAVKGILDPHQEKHYNSLCYTEILTTLTHIYITPEVQIVTREIFVTQMYY